MGTHTKKPRRRNQTTSKQLNRLRLGTNTIIALKIYSNHFYQFSRFLSVSPTGGTHNFTCLSSNEDALPTILGGSLFHIGWLPANRPQRVDSPLPRLTSSVSHIYLRSHMEWTAPSKSRNSKDTPDDWEGYRGS